MDSLRTRLLGKPQEPTLLDELNEQCSLTWSQRIIGFGICFGLGLLMSILCIFFIPGILLNPAAFAVPYTLGNLLSIGSTMFIIGPLRQLKNMFNPTRIIATIIYLGAMAGTLWAAFSRHSALLVLLFIIIQFFALVWYTLSYIPFARTCVKNCIGGVITV